MPPAWLAKFYVFDTRFGSREDNEHEKILYYFPSTTQLGEQQRDVGLSEALVNFTKTFSPDKPCETVRTEKHRHAYKECEPGTWMVLVVRNPVVRNGKSEMYIEDEVNDNVLHNILDNCYNFYSFFNGTVQHTLDTSDADSLRSKLSKFYPAYLDTFHMDITDFTCAYDGLRFFPVERNTYLNIQSCINKANNTLPDTCGAVLMLEDNLVWSGLSSTDLSTLFNYAVGYVHKIDEKRPPPTSQVDASTSAVLFVGKKRPFVFNLESQSDFPSFSLPSVFLADGSQHQLVVLQYNRVNLFFLVAACCPVNVSYLTQLTSYIRPHLKALDTVLGEQSARIQGHEEQFKYVYFNRMNQAMKNSLRPKAGPTLSKDVLGVLSDIQKDFTADGSEVVEVCVKNSHDNWVMGRQSNDRELYISFDQKNSTLVEINDEASKLHSIYFSNIFMD